MASAISIWWLPDARTEWCLVARGKRGLCYSLPNVPNGWSVRVRWPEGTAPTCEPLPADVTAVLAWQLGLPGAKRPTVEEQIAFGQWTYLSRVELMGLDALAERDGPLRVYMPVGDALPPPKRRRLNFGVPAGYLS